MSLKAWECVRCGDLYANPEIELATVECRCGVGAGGWVVATFDVADVAKLRARLRECERERDQWQRVAHKVETERSEAVRERDEAREERAAASADALAQTARLAIVCGERDEARAELESSGNRAMEALTVAFADADAARAEVARLTARLAEVEAGAGAAAMRRIVETTASLCGHSVHVGACLACEARRALLPGGGA